MVAPAQTTAIAASSTPNDHKTKYALAVQLVVTDLIKAYDAGDTLNFTKLKGTAAKKYKLQGIPKLADILQALPIAHRAKLLPFLQTKPVRSASGVAVVGAFKIVERNRNGMEDTDAFETFFFSDPIFFILASFRFIPFSCDASIHEQSLINLFIFVLQLS